ncbi:hypothetical protein SDC9_197715 [bioreactor metagenome]|uniref:Uncharacterized protein n=1 Tax=bioreactor metagenome TaxID=1076179 RepID=A0A645IHY5_9ZZZZ
MPNDEIDLNLPEEVMPAPTPEEIAQWEQERADEQARITEPARMAKEQREESARVIAEHDELMAEMLYEITLNQMGV